MSETNGNGSKAWIQLRAWAQIVQVLAVPVLLWIGSSISSLEKSHAVLVRDVRDAFQKLDDHEKRLREIERGRPPR